MFDCYASLSSIISLMPREKLDRSTLEAALIGYRQQQELIEAKIAEIRERLDKAAKPPTSKARPKGILTTPARKKIVAAQKKRWAEFRRQGRADVGTSGTGPRKRQ